MKEYIYKDDELDIDEDETFIGIIRKGEELIRCKDCDNYCEANFGTWCILNKWYSTENDYCSRAEKEGQND